MLLALDVYYRDTSAQAVCVAFAGWKATQPDQVHVAHIESVAEYEPGAFYKRELPCLLKALEPFDLQQAEAIIIDGYVLLDDDEKPGLGMYLHRAIEAKTPVIGVAKTRFRSLTRPDLVAGVLRGESGNPLWVTAVGLPLEQAVEHLRSMSGPYRIPEILKKTDGWSREAPDDSGQNENG